MTLEVDIAVVEIFEDNVHNLLASSADDVRTCLNICEQQQIGSYIEDLTKTPVTSAEQLFTQFELAQTNRHALQTQVNFRASRSTLIVKVGLTQVMFDKHTG